MQMYLAGTAASTASTPGCGMRERLLRVGSSPSAFPDSGFAQDKMPAHGRHHSACDGGYLPLLASASHFFINEALAAPARGLPFLPIALSAQPDPAAAPPFASASHFFMKDVFAAPERGLPSLPMALAAQSDAAGAAGADFAAVGACANATRVKSRRVSMPGFFGI